VIYAYPKGGGAYVVALENLGRFFGLVAASSLLVDYVLTAAVSIAEATAATFSALEQLGGMFDHLHDVQLFGFLSLKVFTCLLLLAIITYANLRGVRESGLAFAVPSYLFIFCMLSLVLFGIGRALLGVPPVEAVAMPQTNPVGTAVGGLSLFLILRAFTSGCTALTGIEAVADGVAVFKKPEARNAALTLAILGGLLTILFVGITYLANHYRVVPSQYWAQYGGPERGEETVVSQIARATFGVGLPYYVIQAATALILFLAANTSFAAFPQLASLLAERGYLPHQLTNLGERLAFNNGILLLGGAAALLLIAFKGETYALLPLYTVGVFIAFTLAQAGIVAKSLKENQVNGWVFVSGFGCLVTFVVLVVVVITKFWVPGDRATLFRIGDFQVQEGAWLALLMMGLLIALFYAIAAHYQRIRAQLAHIPPEALHPFKHTVIVLVPSRIHRGIVQALNYARSISPDALAVHISFDAAQNEKLHAIWKEYGGDTPLLILESPYRTLVGPLMTYLDAAEKVRDDDIITVVLPEFVPAKWYHQFLHNASGWLIRRRLFQRKDIVLVSVRYFLDA
jgi:amino acid transporter